MNYLVQTVLNIINPHQTLFVMPCDLTPDFSDTRTQTSAQSNSYRCGSNRDHIFSDTCCCLERTGSRCNPILLLIHSLLKRFNSFRCVFLCQIKCVLCRCKVKNMFKIENQSLGILTEEKKQISFQIFPSILSEFLRFFS